MLAFPSANGGTVKQGNIEPGPSPRAARIRRCSENVEVKMLGKTMFIWVPGEPDQCLFELCEPR